MGKPKRAGGARKQTQKDTKPPKFRNFTEEDIDDEIDAFHKQRDIVRLDVDEDTDSSDEYDEVPVIDTEGSDDDDEDEDEDEEEEEEDDKFTAKIAKQQQIMRRKTGGVEDDMHDDNDDDEKQRKYAWEGRNRYGGDNADFEVQSSDDEDALAEEEAEVLRMQKKMVKQLSKEDYGVKDSDEEESSSDEEKTLEDVLPKDRVRSKHQEDKGDEVDGIAHCNEGGGGGVEALHRLKSVDAPLWLTPSPELSQTARTASQHLFSSLKPFCPKSYFDTLLTQGFDPEQIWQQIDLQTKPLISNLTRDVKRFQKNPHAITKLFGSDIGKKLEASEKESEGLDEESEGDEDEGFDDVEDEENSDFDEEDGDEEESEGEEEEKEEGIEDKFLKISELEKYMEEDEAREYGAKQDTAHNDDEEGDEDDEDDDEIGDVDDDSDAEIRYEDFYGVKKKRGSRRELESHDGLGGDTGKKSFSKESKSRDGSDDDDFKKRGSKRKSKLSDASEDEDEQEDNNGIQNQTNGSLSTHEKQLEQLRSKIKQMEQANLDPRTWTMQGEVTASKRPYDSALGEYLDFEHNVRPVPEKSEETQASLEELIIKRIIEGQFDDVQKASLPSGAPREIKELDEKKSKKGLAEIYQDEYLQQTGLGTGPLSSSDELKKEAQLLLDKLFLKLDALSHFHFRPKPVIEDMSIQTNVPALAMEEIAPVVVSDAAMLAPEEVFAGKGDIKEEAELTQADRKRRRAAKKRKFRAKTSKREAKKARDKASTDNTNGKEEVEI